MKKHKRQRIHYRNVKHHIFGTVTPHSFAGYLMFIRSMRFRSDEFVTKNFKNGKQMLFNAKFIISMQEEHTNLHCEICGKQDLKFYPHWEKPNRKILATADHFYPKSYDKERLCFEPKNLIVACYSCNMDKANEFYPLNTIQYPYPKTLDNLLSLKHELDIKETC